MAGRRKRSEVAQEVPTNPTREQCVAKLTEIAFLGTGNPTQITALRELIGLLPKGNVPLALLPGVAKAENVLKHERRRGPAPGTPRVRKTGTNPPVLNGDGMPDEAVDATRAAMATAEPQDPEDTWDDESEDE
jgi:hypothetical protein